MILTIRIHSKVTTSRISSDQIKQERFWNTTTATATTTEMPGTSEVVQTISFDQSNASNLILDIYEQSQDTCCIKARLNRKGLNSRGKEFSSEVSKLLLISKPYSETRKVKDSKQVIFFCRINTFHHILKIVSNYYNNC